MIVIENEKPFRPILGYLLAAALIYLTIDYYFFDKQDWFLGVGYLGVAVWLIRSQKEKAGERIARIEIDPLLLRVHRDNGMMGKIANSEIEEIPMNDLCARIDYRRGGYRLQLLLEKKFFTGSTWEELCNELRKVPVPPASDRAPAF